MRLCEWLGLDSSLLPDEDATVHNQASGKPLITKRWRGVQNSWWYQLVLRRLLPPRTRNWLQRLVLPKAPDRPAPPSPATIEWLKTELSEEVEQISEYAQAAEPLWDGYGSSTADRTAEAANRE